MRRRVVIQKTIRPRLLHGGSAIVNPVRTYQEVYACLDCEMQRKGLLSPNFCLGARDMIPEIRFKGVHSCDGPRTSS